jgi:membrane protein
VIESAVKSANQTGGGTFAAIAGVVTLLLGATTVFGELQSDLDRIWDSPKPEHAGVWGLIKGKLLSFGMVLGIGFLLLVSLVLSAALSAIGKFWSGWFPGWDIVLQAVNFIVSFAVITGLFAMIYKLLPRVEIAWADVWVGAGVTSLLFAIGKLLIGLYLGRSSVASSFGAAGSLVIVLLWVYYSAQIFLLGAEFTKAYSYSHGTRKGQAMPVQAGKPQASKAGSTQPPPKVEHGARHPAPQPAAVYARSRETPLLEADDIGGPFVPIKRPMPAMAKLRIAAGVAATVGLIAGEVLNELRRHGHRRLRRT